MALPPEEHIYVRDARTRHPAPFAEAGAPEIPDPRDVLATLRPRRRARPPLAAAPALLAAAAAIAVAIASVTAARHGAAPDGRSSAAPALTPGVNAIDAPAAPNRP